MNYKNDAYKKEKIQYGLFLLYIYKTTYIWSFHTLHKKLTFFDSHNLYTSSPT
jgi:hypothetical protein